MDGHHGNPTLLETMSGCFSPYIVPPSLSEKCQSGRSTRYHYLFALNCGTGSIRSRISLSHLHLESSPWKIPTPVVTTQNPGFSDLLREKLYTVKPCRLRPHDGANLHTINDPPTPPLYFCFVIYLISTLAYSKILVLFIQAWWEKLHLQ